MKEPMKFQPIYCTEQEMAAIKDYHPGYVYFVADSDADKAGKIYMDYEDYFNNKFRKAFGGAGSNSGIFYANRIISTEEEESGEVIFSKYIDLDEGSDWPQKDDLIFNIEDGAFYRVVSISMQDDSITTNRLTVSGSGGGGGGTGGKEGIKIRIISDFASTIINGEDAWISFIPTADQASGDTSVTVKCSIYAKNNSAEYNQLIWTTTYDCESGSTQTINYGAKAAQSMDQKIYFEISELNNNGRLAKWEKEFITTALDMECDVNQPIPYTLNNVEFNINANGTLNKRIIVYTKGENDAGFKEALKIDKQGSEDPYTHINLSSAIKTNGCYTVRLELYRQSNSNDYDILVQSLEFEIGVIDTTSNKWMIWFGEYQDSYYEYDTVSIPFKILAGSNELEVPVSLVNNANVEILSQIVSVNTTEFNYFEIPTNDLPLDTINHFYLKSGENVSREFSFKLIKDTEHEGFKITTDYLTYNFNTVGSGRSNAESSLQRASYNYVNPQTHETIKAKFDKFNWALDGGNGWVKDDNKVTCLRITNGAKFSVPLGNMTFKGSTNTDQQHTIELRFKTSNIADYSSLVNVITRYKILKDPDTARGEGDLISDSAYVDDTFLYSLFNAGRNNDYTNVPAEYVSAIQNYKTQNYDLFLTNLFKEFPTISIATGRSELNIEDFSTRYWNYDDLEIKSVQNEYNLNNSFCSYYDTVNNVGLAFGPVDMFFDAGARLGSVNASYVENEIISISIVYENRVNSDKNFIYIYENGILSGVTTVPPEKFSIANNAELVFNPTTCDIDLYSIRVYSTALTTQQVCVNYTYDTRDIEAYDVLSKLVDDKDPYTISYKKMIDYNINHPDNPLMPYIVFDTSNTHLNAALNKNSIDTTQLLPYTKATGTVGKITFVNTILDAAYASGNGLNSAAGVTADDIKAGRDKAIIKEYYRTHSPSWTSSCGDDLIKAQGLVDLSVQGTSSQFYPRKNFKIKTKTQGADESKKNVHIFLNQGPYADDFKADEAGRKADKYVLGKAGEKEKFKILSGTNAGKYAYYSDKEGNNETIVSGEDFSYVPNTFYMLNPDYVEWGKEKTRQKYWYMDNDLYGTTKFTMKIDYMESSGSYNMGFANMVAKTYSKHPLRYYQEAGALATQTQSGENKITPVHSNINYADGKYWYYTHKGALKVAGSANTDCPLPETAEELEWFAKGPYMWFAYKGSDKVLGSKKKATLSTDIDVEHLTSEQIAAFKANFEASKDETNKLGEYDQNAWNTWFLKEEASYSYPLYNSNTLSKYRTSVEGIRVLAFNKTVKVDARQGGKVLNNNGEYEYEYQYIGMYNMLLDKGSDECYGFATQNTEGVELYNTYCHDIPLDALTECWEFENNNRTYCSYRDPLSRYELSFKYPDSSNETGERLNSAQSAPIVADSFEYRYNVDADNLDYLMDPVGNKSKENPNYLFDPNDITLNYDKRSKCMYNALSNWEKACQWVWSTCTDIADVPAEKIYKTCTDANIELTEDFYAPGVYYISQSIEQADGTITTSYIISEDVYTPGQNYYIQSENNGDIIYNPIVLVEDTAENRIKYKKFLNYKNNLYIQINKNVFNSCADDIAYEPSQVYWIAESVTDFSGFNPIIEPATGTFDAAAQYYIKVPESGYAGAIQLVSTPVEADFNANKYFVATSKYGYNYDSKEYRAEKFKRELEKHFNKEYLAIYFVMTEVFECYDSRGKNCMMASWGPMEQGGDYIWFPIFYDIDTQLGINNTGIPSFKFNVDVTDEKCFSTSDSVLWNNFYTYCRADILNAYKKLRSEIGQILNTINTVESWYNADYTVTKNLATKVKKPMVAINLDEYYKYIKILTEGYISSSGNLAYDSGTYFYALQGDRSLSRKQFLENRLDYVDSWLNVGNYARNGDNRITGRISANSSQTSDKWIAGPGNPYFINERLRTKAHAFDAEYWVSLKPARSTYVTLGDDNENYPSLKYDGINPVDFDIAAIKTGVQESAEYPEQLLYIYGLNQMQDLGRLYNLYWREFKFDGSETGAKLTKLLLGYDGYTIEDGERAYWHNDYLNPIGWPENGLPLLTHCNLSNIKFNSNNTITIPLAKSSKLVDFRATGNNCNIANVTFAPGVALQTLYLPNSLQSLTLNNANMLTKWIPYDGSKSWAPQYPNIELAEEKKGLYFDTDSYQSLAYVELNNCALGYDLYKFISDYYNKRKTQTEKSTIVLKNVEWSPYIVLTENDIYDSELANKYYYDTGHYTLMPYTYSNDKTWLKDIKAGKIYYYQYETDYNFADYLIKDYSLFTHLTESNFDATISGLVYIDNTVSISENEFRNGLQKQYPDVKFFFANCEEAYTASYVVILDEDDNYKLLYTETTEDIEYRFSTPYDTALIPNFNETIYSSSLRPHYDFLGWSTSTSIDDIIPEGAWSGSELTKAGACVNHSITYYALGKKHEYFVKYYNDDNAELFTDTVYTAVHGEAITQPNRIPASATLDQLEFLQDNEFLGFSIKPGSKEADDINNIIANASGNGYTSDNGGTYKFYAVYKKTNDIHTEEPKYNLFNIAADGTLSLKNGVQLQGKILIPYEMNSIKIKKLANFKNQKQLTHIFLQKGGSSKTINSELNAIADSCFEQSVATSAFVYCELPQVQSQITIGNKAFYYNMNFLAQSQIAPELSEEEYLKKYIEPFFNSIKSIGSQAFYRAFARSTDSRIAVSMPSTIIIYPDTVINQQGFYNSPSSIKTIIFGSKAQPFKLANLLAAQDRDCIFKGGQVFYRNYPSFGSDYEPIRINIYVSGTEAGLSDLLANMVDAYITNSNNFFFGRLGLDYAANKEFILNIYDADKSDGDPNEILRTYNPNDV